MRNLTKLSVSLPRKRGVHWRLAHWAASWHLFPLVVKLVGDQPKSRYSLVVDLGSD